MGSMRWTVLKMKSLEKNIWFSLVLRTTLIRLPHHLLRLQWLLIHQLLCPSWSLRHQLAPKVPPLPRPALFKQVNLLFHHLLIGNGEIYSPPTVLSHLVQGLCTFQHFMIFNPVQFYPKILTTPVTIGNCVPLVMFLVNFPVTEL
jgi:hypothetical protein